MRKILCSLLVLATAVSAKASHILGGEIRYEYTGSSYKVELMLYAQCSPSVAILSSSESVTVKSAACNTNMTLSLARYSVDTLDEAWCPSSGASCTSVGGYPVVIAARYSGTVASLAPCSDWKFVYESGARSASIMNLASAATLNLYLEAGLNNSVAPNSSPVFSNLAPSLAFINTANTTPFQVLDIEGDSLGASMYIPQTTGGASATYAAGYSITAPMGSTNGVNLNIAGGYLSTYATTTGGFCLATRISDYRNGTLVGYSSRDWVQTVIPGTAPKAPFPAAGSIFTYNTCPGATTTVPLSFIDSIATDSVYLDVLPQNGLTYTTSVTPGVGSATGTITWTTPTTYTPATNPYFFIRVYARDNRCPYRGNAWYTILVKNGACAADSVWPGDANADKIVNLYDPLFIALGYGNTGAARTGASIAWTPQACTPWSSSFTNGVNKKHADCDGNGTINLADLGAVVANYGQVHLRGTGDAQYKGAGLPDLYFDHSGVYAYPGATVTIPVKLGNSSAPMTDMYGLAARISIQNVSNTNPSISYPASWIGTSTNTLRFSKATSSGSIDWAYARTDQQNINGQGAIAALTFTVPATATIGQKIVLRLQDVKMIDKTGNEVNAFNVLADSLTVQPTSVGTVATFRYQMSVVPNPSMKQATVQLYAMQPAALKLMVTDMAGRVVWQTNADVQKGRQVIALPETLAGRLYLVRLSDEAGAEVVKWSKGE